MLRISLKPSRYLAGVLTVAHVCSALVLIPLDMAAWLKVIIGLLIAASLISALSRHAFLKGARSTAAFELHENDLTVVHLRDGTSQEARILGTTYVSPLLTLLNLKIESSRFAHHIVLMPDSATHDELRQLRVRLRWGVRPEAVS